MTFCFSIFLIFWLGLKKENRKKKEPYQAYQFTEYSYGCRLAIDLQPV